jgi:predicted kinase
VLIDQQVRMFDCIEFNEKMRWIDVADEIAFTYMDLLAHQQPGLANGFIDEMLSRTGDYEAVRVLRFYAVYRALVRAKVAAIQMKNRQDDGAEARAGISLAERLAAPTPKRLIITHGLSGCGKTYASTLLMQRDPVASTVRIRSDVERKRLFGLAAAEHGEAGPQAGIYSPQVNALTYARLHSLAEMLLLAGGTVIVDAAFLRRADRDAFHALAVHAGARFEILAPVAAPARLAERIEARRAAGQDASDATPEVLAQQMRTLEPLTQDERRLAGLDTP